MTSQQKLFVFKGRNDKLKIELLDLENDSLELMDYHQIEGRHDLRGDYEFDVILAFENIVAIFDFQALEIWCHHLLDNKSYKSLYQIPESMEYSNYEYVQSCVVKAGNNYAHILNFASGDHIKIDLHKLMPKGLLKSHREYYQPLIMGYLREKENENNISCIPFVLKTIILKFFAL